MTRPMKIRQRELFDPDGPESVLQNERRQDLILLLARLLREATTSNPATRKGGAHEPDHV